MKLWSIQEEIFYRKLTKDQIIYGDLRRVAIDDRPFYRWMSKQMYERGVAKNSKFAPIWAWYIYENQIKRRPDLRHSLLLPKNTRGVRIEMDVPNDHCLLSQFEMWTHVLNNKNIPENFEEYEQIEKSGIDQDQTVKSWDRIFDLKFGDTDYWKPFEQREIQACLPFMSLAWVRKVDFFLAR